MILVILRTLILFSATFLVLRIMGKREIGQLQPYELVIIIMISELAAVPMENIGIPILRGIIPIFILFALQVTLAYVSMKSERARGTICGKPSVLIKNSQIDEAEMARQRYNINDLLEQLRSKNAPNIADVEFAILETSGQLSVILKSQKRPVEPEDLNVNTKYEGLPATLIIDGHIIHENLFKINLSLDWLRGELTKFGILNTEDVLFASLDTEGKLYFQVKGAAREKVKGVLAGLCE